MGASGTAQLPCEECSAQSVVPIIYGFPASLEGVGDTWVAGGCTISIWVDEKGNEVGPPSHQCIKCGAEFKLEEVPEWE